MRTLGNAARPRAGAPGRLGWLALGATGAIGYLLLRSRGSRGFGQPNPDAPRAVVLGAGFAGLAAATELSKRLSGRAHVTLVDQHNYHLFTPLLYQVATCGIDPYDIAFPARQLSGRRGFQFQCARVTEIDPLARHLRTSDGVIEYDYLLVALGSTTNFFGNRGAMAHSLPLKSLADGIAIRHALIDALEAASVATEPSERQALLTFAIVGGGATGVETAAALSDLLQRVLPAEYPRLDPQAARVIVVESEGKLLGHMSDRLARMALKRLRHLNVEVWLNAEAQEVTTDGLTTKDGRSLRARSVVWTTGVEAPPVISNLRVPHGKGGSLKVNQYLQVEGFPDIYAAGDCAHYEDSRTGRPVPLLAQSAEQEGAAAAANLARAIAGQPQVPFHFRSRGNAISLGRADGAVEYRDLVVNGLIGGLAWRLIHLAKTAGLRNRLSTALDWGIDFLQGQDTARLDLSSGGSSSTARSTSGGNR